MRGGVKVTNVVTLKKPSADTLQREKTEFIAALEWARRETRPWLTREKVDEIRAAREHGRAGKPQRGSERARQALTRAQTKALLTLFEKWSEAEKNRVDEKGKHVPRKNYERRLMALHARLLLCSGMRPGAEINDITWDDVAEAPTSNGVIIVINMCGAGKTGRRRVNCLPEAVGVIGDLRALLREFGFSTTGRASLWPSLTTGGAVADFNRSFKGALAKIGLGKAGREQPLYCLRHTYITLQLLDGVQIGFLAINCGTSAEMIERYYSCVKSEQIAGDLIPKTRSTLAWSLTAGSSGRRAAPTLILDPKTGSLTTR